jgi:lipopolysaccharide transport system ATP-binding protein
VARVLLDNVSVDYPIYASFRQRSLLSLAANHASFGRLARGANNVPVVSALKEINLDLRDGDRLAIFGRNGAGKSTLLRTISGVLYPDRGRIEVEGTRASLISLGAGLDMEKSGAENVEMLGALLGLSKAKRGALLQDVAEFTDLGDFMSLPVRTYSTGMGMRLMLGVATGIDRDILVLDELIATGDAFFVKKAQERAFGFFGRSSIIVMATHSPDIAETFCNKAIVLDRGAIVFTGAPKDARDFYLNSQNEEAA